MEGARAAVERLWPGRRATVEELGGGITNRNYKITVENEVFVLRMGGAKTELLGIDRAVEFAAGKRAFEVGVGPEVVHFEPAEGWLVSRFVAGRSISLDEMRSPSTLTRVAFAMRAFHDASPIPGGFNALATVDSYRATAEAHGVAIPGEFGRARAIAERIRVARGAQPKVPCHNDLLNGNFLDDGSVRIVDWEYAGMGDRFFDLANFSVNHEFGVVDDRGLLHAYFGRVRDGDLASLRLMLPASRQKSLLARRSCCSTGITMMRWNFGYVRACVKVPWKNPCQAADPDFERLFMVIERAYGLDQKN